MGDQKKCYEEKNCHKKENCYDKIWKDCNKKVNVAQELCCCQQGIFEALTFLKNQGQQPEGADVIVRGFRPGEPGELGSGTITTLTRDIVILSDDPTRVISLCAIWLIRVDTDELPNGLNNSACGTVNTSCCCNPGLRERLATRIGQEVEINLDDSTGSTVDTTGTVRLVCDDIVWIEACAGESENCEFVAIPLCRIAWFEPVVSPPPE